MSVYNRLNHIQRAIEALQKNTLASDSGLYIFSDAPREGDEEAVGEVREYISRIDGFAEVNIIEREKNSRVYNNRSGVRYLLDKYGELIWMEEDIVTAPGFLEFMNKALERYRNEDKVFSITGYTPPIKLPADHVNDVFFLQRFNAWGFGTWKNKFDRIEERIDPADYRRKIRNHAFYSKLVRNGLDIPRMIDLDINGKLDALDVKIMYQQALHDWCTVYPKQSLVQNIGHDGSGLHCYPSDRFRHDRLWDKTKGFAFPEVIEQDERIVRANSKFRRPGILVRVAEKMKYIRLFLFG